MKHSVLVRAVLRFGASNSGAVRVFLAASDAAAFQFGLQAEGHEFQGMDLAHDLPGDALTAVDPIVHHILLVGRSRLTRQSDPPSCPSSPASSCRAVGEAQYAPLLDNVDAGSGGPPGRAGAAAAHPASASSQLRARGLARGRAVFADPAPTSAARRYAPPNAPPAPDPADSRGAGRAAVFAAPGDAPSPAPDGGSPAAPRGLPFGPRVAPSGAAGSAARDMGQPAPVRSGRTSAAAGRARIPLGRIASATPTYSATRAPFRRGPPGSAPAGGHHGSSGVHGAPQLAGPGPALTGFAGGSQGVTTFPRGASGIPDPTPGFTGGSRDVATSSSGASFAGGSPVVPGACRRVSDDARLSPALSGSSSSFSSWVAPGRPSNGPGAHPEGAHPEAHWGDSAPVERSSVGSRWGPHSPGARPEGAHPETHWGDSAPVELSSVGSPWGPFPAGGPPPPTTQGCQWPPAFGPPPLGGAPSWETGSPSPTARWAAGYQPVPLRDPSLVSSVPHRPVALFSADTPSGPNAGDGAPAVSESSGSRGPLAAPGGAFAAAAPAASWRQCARCGEWGPPGQRCCVGADSPPPEAVAALDPTGGLLPAYVGGDGVETVVSSVLTSAPSHPASVQAPSPSPAPLNRAQARIVARAKALQWQGRRRVAQAVSEAVTQQQADDITRLGIAAAEREFALTEQRIAAAATRNASPQPIPARSAESAEVAALRAELSALRATVDAAASSPAPSSRGFSAPPSPAPSETRESAELAALRAELAATRREAEASRRESAEQRARDKVDREASLAALQALSKSASEANMRLPTIPKLRNRSGWRAFWKPIKLYLKVSRYSVGPSRKLEHIEDGSVNDNSAASLAMDLLLHDLLQDDAEEFFRARPEFKGKGFAKLAYLKKTWGTLSRQQIVADMLMFFMECNQGSKTVDAYEGELRAKFKLFSDAGFPLAPVFQLMFMVRGLESEHKHLLVEAFRTGKLTLADTTITQVVEWVKDASDPLWVTIGGDGKPTREKSASANQGSVVPRGQSGAQGGSDSDGKVWKSP